MVTRVLQTTLASRCFLIPLLLAVTAARADVLLYWIEEDGRSNMFVRHGPNEAAAHHLLQESTGYAGPDPASVVKMRCTKENGRDKGWWIIARGAAREGGYFVPGARFLWTYGCGLEGSAAAVVAAARVFCLEKRPGCAAEKQWDIGMAYNDGVTFRPILGEGGGLWHRESMGSPSCACEVDLAAGTRKCEDWIAPDFTAQCRAAMELWK